MKAFRSSYWFENERLSDSGIVVWEHYLVYATSLKIADKVMEQLEVRLPKTLDDGSLATSAFLGMGYYYPRYRLWYTFGRINSSMSRPPERSPNHREAQIAESQRLRPRRRFRRRPFVRRRRRRFQKQIEHKEESNEFIIGSEINHCDCGHLVVVLLILGLSAVIISL